MKVHVYGLEMESMVLSSFRGPSHLLIFQGNEKKLASLISKLKKLLH